MPHATLPVSGFQAIILCGPGESLAPFNANPVDFPKALIPIANRPMVWYPLEWCYRMGVTDITLITPPISLAALESAFSVNPQLTSLPSPRPTLLAPADAALTTGTAELFRLPEVQQAITGDFIVLPCDLVCELAGTTLLETWMSLQGGLAGTSHGGNPGAGSIAPGLGGERSGRRGGLGVWYQTKDAAEGGVGVKKEETDFLASTELTPPIVPPPLGSLRPNVRNVVMAMPRAALQDTLEEQKVLPIRQALLRRHGKIKMQMSHRDAHVYFFPYWVKEMMRRNDMFESVGEDVLGWWAKACWQEGLAQKLGLGEVFAEQKRDKSKSGTTHQDGVDERIDLASLSSTWTSKLEINDSKAETTQNGDTTQQNGEYLFASRVTNTSRTPSAMTTPTLSRPPSFSKPYPITAATVPTFQSYIHPAHPPAQLIRRVDTVPLLLSVSLYLAKLEATGESTDVTDDISASAPNESTSTTSPSPFAHTYKIHPTSTLPPQVTLPPGENLIDANVTLAPRSTIRESVIGTGCVLGAPPASSPSSISATDNTTVDSTSSAATTATTTAIASPSSTSTTPAPSKPRQPSTTTPPSSRPTSSQQQPTKPLPGIRLHRTLLMANCIIESGAKLTGCVLGRGCRIGAGCELTDCYVQEGFVVASGTVAKGETLAMGVDEGEGALEMEGMEKEMGMEDGEGGNEEDEDDEEDGVED